MRTLVLCAFALILSNVNVCAQTQSNPIVLKDAAGVVLNSYPTLQSAYNAIPATLTQSYTVEISGSYDGTGESFPIIFTEKADASASNRIIIKPKASETGDIFGPVINAPMMILDGADWIFFDGPPADRSKLLFFNCDNDGRSVPTTFAAYPAVVLRNGATHNTFSHCQFRSGNLGFNSHEAPALLFEGTNNSQGNDSNTVINCTFLSSDNMLAAEGTPAVPNKGLQVVRNTFGRIGEDAVRIGEGNAGFILDGNTVTLGHTTTGPYPQSYGFFITHLADTCRIRGNKFTYRISPDSNVTAISIANASGTGYALVANNGLNLGDSYTNNLISAYSTATTRDAGNYPVGIAIEGAGLVQAGIFHNTIRFNRNYDTASTSLGFSDCFRYNGTNAGNRIELKNNLFLNTRRGGASGSAHLAMNLVSTLGILSDYNTYSPGATIKADTTRYLSYSAWQTANPDLDVHSNDSSVLFETANTSNLSIFDTFYSVRLSAAMYLWPAIKGISLSNVTDDISGNPRQFPYRGCSEINPACSLNSGLLGSIFTQPNQIICSGASVWLHYVPAGNNNSVLHQWQQRAAGATTFTDAPGETGTDLLIAPSGDIEYRVKDSCVAGGSAAAYSYEIPITVLDPAVPGTLSEVHNGSDYTFTVTGSSGITGYNWDLGDGASFNTTNPVLSYTYAAPGTYQVKVYPQGCSAGMLQLTVQVWAAGINATFGNMKLEVYPNPASHLLQIKLDKTKIQGVLLTDPMGRIVSRMTSSNNHVMLDVSTLPNGYYLLRIQTENGALYQPVTVLH